MHAIMTVDTNRHIEKPRSVLFPRDKKKDSSLFFCDNDYLPNTKSVTIVTITQSYAKRYKYPPTRKSNFKIHQTNDIVLRVLASRTGRCSAISDSKSLPLSPSPFSFFFYILFLFLNVLFTSLYDDVAPALPPTNVDSSSRRKRLAAQRNGAHRKTNVTNRTRVTRRTGSFMTSAAPRRRWSTLAGNLAVGPLRQFREASISSASVAFLSSH